ncbi:hypothetical protein EJV46_02495 [Roseococcus sp. SYP-B2431]|nr:hypothetical protein EJV46_02495 [Roseococcus sp. SYP-B2431]
MRPAPILILLAASMLPGCGFYSRSPGQQVTAPDPTLYPAPAAGLGRYIPWASGWIDAPPMTVGGPLRISRPGRSTPGRDPMGSLPTGP